MNVAQRGHTQPWFCAYRIYSNWGTPFLEGNKYLFHLVIYWVTIFDMLLTSGSKWLGIFNMLDLLTHNLSCIMCSSGNILVFWSLEKRHPLKFALSTGCLYLNKYGIVKTKCPRCSPPSRVWVKKKHKKKNAPFLEKQKQKKQNTISAKKKALFDIIIYL